MVKHERYLVGVEIDLDHAIDRLADDAELVKRRFEQAPLHVHD
jgi:hypothetical protein